MPGTHALYALFATLRERLEGRYEVAVPLWRAISNAIMVPKRSEALQGATPQPALLLYQPRTLQPLRGHAHIFQLVVLLFVASVAVAQQKTMQDTLHETVISAKKIQPQAQHHADGNLMLTKDNFNALPTFLGEHDPMRALQLQTGVQSGSEGGRGIFVRGGSPDQNLMTFDGAPVFNPSHLYGFISVFNGDAVESVDFYKDKLPSRFGGRLCSAIAASGTEGNTARIKGTVSVGFTTSRLHLDGPLTRNGRTTFSVSVRGCYIGLWSGPISKRQYEAAGYSGRVYYYFMDVNAKVVHRFSDRTKLALSFFTNQDFYSFSRNGNTTRPTYTSSSNSRNDLQWSNWAVALNFTHQFGADWKLFQHASFSRYALDTKSTYQSNWKSSLPDQSEYHRDDIYKRKSFINSYTLSTELRQMKERHQFSIGAGFVATPFQTGTGSKTRDVTGKPASATIFAPAVIPTYTAFAFAEASVQPVQAFQLTVGCHARFYHAEQWYPSLLPRISLIIQPITGWRLRGALSATNQPLHLLTAASADVLNDFWVPASQLAPPESSWNFSGGMQHLLPKGFEWSIDGFYRTMQHVVDYREGVVAGADNEHWEQQVYTNGEGRSYGMEVYAARNTGKITGSVAYTLSWSERKFSEINHGNWYPYKYDRRHNLAVQVQYKINAHWEVSAAFVYGTGYRYTVPIQNYTSWYDNNAMNSSPAFFRDILPQYASRNSYVLPSYQHLDVGMTYRKKKKRLEHEVNVSIYNLYNHFNQFAVYAEEKYSESGTPYLKLKQVSLFPILPSLTYTLYLE